MELLAKMIGILIISLILISIPILSTLSILLNWIDIAQGILCILTVFEYVALIDLIAKSTIEKKERR